MNQSFDFRRFLLILKLDTSEKGKSYLMMAGLLLALLIFLMLPIAIVREPSMILMFLHALALFMVVIFGGSLYTNQAFSQYGSSSTGISAIMIPASRMEKFLSALFLNLLFVVPLMLLFLKLHHYLTDYANAKPTIGTFRYKPIPPDALTYFVLMYIMIQGFVFLGSIYFKKLSYIKTAISFFVIYVLVTALSLWQANFLAGNPSKLVTFPFTSWKVSYYALNKHYDVMFPSVFQDVVYAFPSFLILGMWYISYIRLKEKQI
ncbi:hypothetical protein [Dyadobacter sp. 32]|uniref:hypothetical protein n=1 Tax=Dyadobacter sp. 32 TaxID=538966 RepID=UPI0011ECA937